jgi:RNA polymerase sigma factor (sigma-70 family)
MGRTSFEDYFPALWDLAYRVAYRMSGSREQAEDVAQTTLERAFKRWRSVSGYCEPWVVRVATNLSLDAHRASAHTSRGIELGSADAAVSDTFVVERLELREALAGLPERQRSVIVLRHLYDFSVAETAAVLGISRGSVKTHSHRALEALRGSMPDQKGMLLPKESS